MKFLFHEIKHNNKIHVGSPKEFLDIKKLVFEKSVGNLRGENSRAETESDGNKTNFIYYSDNFIKLFVMSIALHVVKVVRLKPIHVYLHTNF